MKKSIQKTTARFAIYAASFGLLAAASSSPAAQAPFIGGWDTTRGGTFSLAEGSSTSTLRSAITTAFPTATITATPTLTSEYLNTINVLLISAITGEETTGITPLSKTEQRALSHFVENGGIALLFVDNKVNAPNKATNSMIGPFGMHSTNYVSGYVSVTSAGASLPVINGPFENITSYSTVVPGWFDVVGTSTILGTLSSNGEAALLYYSTGTLCSSLYAGAVVASADSSMLDNAFATNDDINLVLNAIALGVPRAGLTVTLSPGSVVGGNPATGTVTIGIPAPGNGLTFTLTSLNPAVVSVPASVTVAGNTTSGQFNITTSSVKATTEVLITVSDGNETYTTALIVTP